MTEMPDSDDRMTTGILPGRQPFALLTDSVDGTSSILRDGDMVTSFSATGGVIFSAKDLTVNASRVIYAPETSRVTASGKRIVIRWGDLLGTCQLFEYHPVTGEAQLRGNPAMYWRDKDGNAGTRRGREIDIFLVNGSPQYRVKGSGISTGTSQTHSRASSSINLLHTTSPERLKPYSPLAD